MLKAEIILKGGDRYSKPTRLDRSHIGKIPAIFGDNPRKKWAHVDLSTLAARGKVLYHSEDSRRRSHVRLCLSKGEG